MPKGELVVKGNFEWDSEKDKANIKKHGFSFEEILPVFDDPCFLESFDDVNSSWFEDGYIGVEA